MADVIPLVRVRPGDPMSAPPAPATPAELGRLRRGELDRQAVVAWMEQSRALIALVEPGLGPLPASGTGWLLGVGPVRHRLWPRLSPWLVGSCALSPLGAIGVAFAGLPHPYLLSMLSGMAPVALAFASAVLLGRRKVRRQLERADARCDLTADATGTLVLVRGTIAPQETVPTLFRGVPSVLFRNRVGEADETRGIDFVLDLDDGRRVRVGARGALLLEPLQVTREPPRCGPVSPDRGTDGQPPRLRSTLLRPPPLRARWLDRHECSVGPGDAVEVCGILHREPVPDESGPYDRRFPLGFVLRAGPGTPLVVRRPSPVKSGW